MAQGTQIGRGYIAVSVDEKGARAALRGFVGFAGSAFKAAAVSAGVLTGAAAKVGITFNSMQEQASIAFTTLLGDGAKAQSFMEDLQRFAAKTPFEMPGLIDNARQLLGVGVAANKVIPTMQALGNASGALGLNQDAFNRVLLATTQAMGKGKLQGEELMQMVEAGIPVWQLLAKATGKTVPELQEMSSAGELLAQDTLPKLFAQMNKDYGGAMAAQSQTLAGQWSSLKDNTQILMGTAFKPLFNETKRLTGALNGLASSDTAQEWAKSFAGGLERGIDAVKIFGARAKTELGPDLEDLLDRAQDRFAELWPIVKDGAEAGGSALMKIAANAVPSLLQLSDVAGGVLKAALEAVRDVLEAVERNSDELGEGIATAANVAGAVAGPAFLVLAKGLQLAADVLTLLVDLVGDLSGPLGAITGGAVAAAVAWRALSTVLGVVPGLWKRINPADVADGLKGFASRADEVALSAGVMTERLTGSAKAGERVMTTGSRMGSALTKVGSALPFVGIAAVGLGLAFEAAARQSQELADGLVRGGGAAAQAQAQIDAMRKVTERSQTGFVGFVNSITGIGDQYAKTADQAEAAARAQIDAMTNVERAQYDARNAQYKYDEAVKDHGVNSAEAVAAQRTLVTSTADVAAAQRDAATATESHREKLARLATEALSAVSADVAMRQAQLNVTTSQKAYTKAVQEHGIASVEAQQAGLNLEQSYLQAANAAMQKAAADNAGKDAAEIAAAQSTAYTTELFRLAGAAGGTAPPALAKLITGLDGTKLSAIGAKVSIDGAGNAVYTLPNGKKIVVSADTLAAIGAMEDVKDQYQNVTFTWAVNVAVSNAIGALQSAASVVGRRAGGGSMRPNAPYLVGEEGPELVTPNVSGYVHDAHSTAEMLAGAGSRGGMAVTQNNYALPGMDINQVADLVVNRLMWRAA